MSTASQPRLINPRATKRERWGVRPAELPQNSHIPRYCTLIDDALARRVGPLWTYERTMWAKGEKVDNDRRKLRGSLSEICVWVGQHFGDKPIPRSTMHYWLDQLILLHLIQPWDDIAGGPAAPRYRGDGRHKTVWIINSKDRALSLLAADDAVATPKNRTFWVWNGKPCTTKQAVDWKLDVAIAERLPEAWENNARFYDPNAPMKPLRRTVRAAQASSEDIERIHTLLAGEWKIATTREQAAEILRWARGECEQIPAAALETAIRGKIQGQIQLNHVNRRPSIFTIKFFSRDLIRGLASVWHQGELLRMAEEARSARRLAELATRTGTGHDPPLD